MKCFKCVWFQACKDSCIRAMVKLTVTAVWLIQTFLIETSVWTPEPDSSSKLWAFKHDLCSWLTDRCNQRQGNVYLCSICRPQNIWSCGSWHQNHLKLVLLKRCACGWPLTCLQWYPINEPDLIWLLWHVSNVSAVGSEVKQWKHKHTCILKLWWMERRNVYTA